MRGLEKYIWQFYALSSAMSLKKMEIMIPETIYLRLEKIEQKKGIRKEDILMRTLVKVIEEFEAGGG